jgi:hypothetical protein
MFEWSIGLLTNGELIISEGEWLSITIYMYPNGRGVIMSACDARTYTAYIYSIMKSAPVAVRGLPVWQIRTAADNNRYILCGNNVFSICKFTEYVNDLFTNMY